MNRCPFWVATILVWMACSGFVSGEAQLYSKAVKFAKAGQSHFAFMHYNKLLRNYPESKYRQQALFATGEYYFQVAEFNESAYAFKSFLDENPRSQEKLYALAYLMRIADRNENSGFFEELKKRIIDLQQVSFIFRESKEIHYSSPLDQQYKAVMHINKIDFFLDGKLFAKVVY